MFTASILKIVYDIELDDSNDSYLQIAEETLNGVAEAGVVGAFLVDMIPLREEPKYRHHLRVLTFSEPNSEICSRMASRGFFSEKSETLA